MKIVKTMRKMPFPELRGSLESIRYPAMAEIKFDGEFNWIIHNGDGSPYLVNKNGKERSDFHVTINALEMSKGRAFRGIGELFFVDGKLGRLYDLISSQGKIPANLGFYCFDLFQVDGLDITQLDYLTRQETLGEILPGFIHDQPTIKLVRSEQEAILFFTRVVAEGYEGIVLKNLDSKFVLGPCSWHKMKFKDTTDYEVAYIDPTRERIEIRTRDGNGNNWRTVGVKVLNANKRYLNVGDVVTIEHQGVLSGGGLRHPVYKGLSTRIKGGEVSGVASDE